MGREIRECRTEQELALAPVAQQLGRIAAALEQTNQLLGRLTRESNQNLEWMGSAIDGLAEAIGRVADCAGEQPERTTPRKAGS